ncbi:hypothetical protein PENSPDRAFT_693370 [Peniophora sp. CONT]|nr:hypothetical protein PENSPDRAFT_693370 [Peniophora sp. CONT]
MVTTFDDLVRVACQELDELRRSEIKMEDDSECENMHAIPSWTTSTPGRDKLKMRPVHRKRRKEIAQASREEDGHSESASPPSEHERLLSTPSSSSTLVLDSFTPLLSSSPASTACDSDEDVDMLADDPTLKPAGRKIEPSVLCRFGARYDSVCEVHFTRSVGERDVRQHLEECHGLARPTAAVASLPQNPYYSWPQQVELIDALNPAFIRIRPSATVPPTPQPTVCTWAGCNQEMLDEDLSKHVLAHINAVWTSTNTAGAQWRWVAYEPRIMDA